MVSVEEALGKIKITANKLDVIELHIINALGYVLSADLYSPINMPPFDQSAMDGYALCLIEGNEYQLVGEVKAGDESHFDLKPGEAVRIFTGAMIPKGANAVAKQEIVSKKADIITIQENVSQGENIRLTGEQIKTNELALEKGTYLNPGAIGFITTLGLTHVSVYRKPVITVIATGNELTKPGAPLELGKIYESNTFTLQAALNYSGYDVEIKTVEDDYDATRTIIDTAINSSDVVIMTGGISVGDYDFVEAALSELEVISDFYKVKQKPGKPLFFGHKGKKIVFALPGNPAAVLSCFYVYVLPCLNLMIGRLESMHITRELKLKNNYKKTAAMTHFLKAYSKNGEVEILSAQSSAMLSSFVKANCIVKMNQDQEEWKVGDSVEAIMLPV